LETAVVIKHKPTGLVVRSCTERSQYQNKMIALEILRSRLQQGSDNILHRNQNIKRQIQIGSGERGDKIRTYREKDDRVIDHRTGRKGSLKQWLRGNLKVV
jgi:peptide chain release factor 1